jgi:hypothetical protein
MNGKVSLSELFIKLVGIVLAFVGFGLILACFGLSIAGVSFMMFGLLGQFVMGVILLGMGIYIIRGGTVGL